ncbi:hypothetical protein SDC9_149587 [bioreactor metagenome]|uniref:Uncharacterized protein n=1 Tax=bioreactor metagenome TaxID=1076179 RepID=A0A645EK71_9ZZZZ
MDVQSAALGDHPRDIADDADGAAVFKGRERRAVRVYKRGEFHAAHGFDIGALFDRESYFLSAVGSVVLVHKHREQLRLVVAQLFKRLVYLRHEPAVSLARHDIKRRGGELRQHPFVVDRAKVACKRGVDLSARFKGFDHGGGIVKIDCGVREPFLSGEPGKVVIAAVAPDHADAHAVPVGIILEREFFVSGLHGQYRGGGADGPVREIKALPAFRGILGAREQVYFSLFQHTLHFAPALAVSDILVPPIGISSHVLEQIIAVARAGAVP